MKFFPHYIASTSEDISGGEVFIRFVAGELSPCIRVEGNEESGNTCISFYKGRIRVDRMPNSEILLKFPTVPVLEYLSGPVVEDYNGNKTEVGDIFLSGNKTLLAINPMYNNFYCFDEHKLTSVPDWRRSCMIKNWKLSLYLENINKEHIIYSSEFSK